MLSTLRRLAAYRWLLDPRLREPEGRFLIFGQSRSGSTLLVDLLNSHPRVRCEGEIYYHRTPAPRLYRRARARHAGADVYGFKMHVHQLDYKLRTPDPARFVRELHEDGYRFLYLRRANSLRQVLSDQRRSQGGRTHYRGGSRPERRALRVDVAEVMAHLELRERYWREAEALLAPYPHHTVVYERDLADGRRHQATMDGVFAFLGLEPVRVETELVRINTRPIAELVENYEELRAAVAASPHAAMLEEAAAAPAPAEASP